ncbi:unnamed protein product [Lupinus luteus]|uniref:L-dopachrome isomerase n=1 Tax=Lupinus luteus TaxID=3873 RepID=A0AAV1Y157_LUPLU
MPTLILFTNVPVDSVTASDILRDATKAVAKIIGKPKSYAMILLHLVALKNQLLTVSLSQLEALVQVSLES